jgi:DNA adenine methylase
MELEDDIQKAAYYFVINRCSFSGATLSGGYSNEAANKRFTENSILNLSNLNLSKCKFYNYDFEKFITKKMKDKCFLFLDPPYYLQEKSKLYGNNGDLHETFDHSKLYTIIKNYTNWMLCYNDCAFIRDLYKDYQIIDVDWNYGMNKSKKSSEIIILSL